jgi:hypothetical protein
MLDDYPAQYMQSLFKTMMRAEEYAQGHIFDVRDIRDPFFCHCYIDSCDTRGRNAVFASKDIAKDELFCLTPLTLVSSEVDFVKLNTKQDRLLDVTRDHLCIYNDRFQSFSYVDMFTNHCCHPTNNSRTIEYMVFPEIGCIGEGFVATRDIEKDREITIDYGVFEYEHVDFTCECGAIDCVKRYRGSRYYSKSRQDALMAERQLDPSVMAEVYEEANDSRRSEIQTKFLPLLSEEETFLFYFTLCALADEDE